MIVLAVLGLGVAAYLTVVHYVGFSAYLTYREAASIHAYCEWCLSSAVILTILFVCAIARYLIGAPLAPAPADDAGAPGHDPTPDAPAPDTLISPRV